MANSFVIAEIKARLSACWKVDIDWKLYPKKLEEVSYTSKLASLLRVLINLLATIYYPIQLIYHPEGS